MTVVVYLCVAGAFALGYLVGRVNLLVFMLAEKPSPGPAGFFQKNKPSALRENAENPAARVADIDARKFVAPISTAGLERKDTGALGKTTMTEDDIQASVSKLAQLKGR